MNIFAKKLKRKSIETQLLDFIEIYEIDALIIQYRYDAIKNDVVSLEDHITEKLELKLNELKSK